MLYSNSQVLLEDPSKLTEDESIITRFKYLLILQFLGLKGFNAIFLIRF